MLNASCTWCLPLQHSSPYSSFYRSVRRPQSQPTTRLSDWAPDAAYDCLWNNAREKSRSYHLCSSSPTPDLEPLRMEAPRLLMEAGNSSWSISLPCSPLCQLRIKATFLFPPNSASISLISDKAKILATNSVKAFEFSCTHWLSCCWNKSVSLYAKWA